MPAKNVAEFSRPVQPEGILLSISYPPNLLYFGGDSERLLKEVSHDDAQSLSS
jgi:hypothetical protein